MKALQRGIAVAVLQCLIVLSVAGKYAIDRARLPRVWVKTVPYDPNLYIRGRYLSLLLTTEGHLGTTGYAPRVKLSVEDGKLVATPAASNTGVYALQDGEQTARLLPPVPFFIPEHVADPSRRSPGEELWVEVSLPKTGMPRPIRLGIRKDGVLTPLDLR